MAALLTLTRALMKWWRGAKRVEVCRGAGPCHLRVKWFEFPSFFCAVLLTLFFSFAFRRPQIPTLHPSDVMEST